MRHILTVSAVMAGAALPAAAELSAVQRAMIERRACEAAIWGMPAVGVYDIELALQRDAGAAPGVVGYMTEPMDSRHGFLTANDVTPYTFTGLSTKDGPIVIDVPPAGEKAAFFGTIVNAWQVPIADVGTSGEDAGEGGKYVILPPDFEGAAPEGDFRVYQSNTYGVHFAFRPVAKNGGSSADQAAYAQTLKWYPLAEMENPPETRFIDVKVNPVNTLPVYDMTYFHDLNTVVQREPVLERDKVMMGMLASLGIKRGEAFEPDAETQEAMLAGLQCAYDAMQEHFITRSVVPLWEDRTWGVWAFAEGQPEAGFPYETEDMVLIDDRAGGSYSWITYLPRKLGGGTFYLTGLTDSDGTALNGEDTYKLTVPADTPAEDFWSVIVYSMNTKGFVAGNERVGLATPDLPEMQVNDDGSADVYFAPQAPEGLESNWIPTGEDFFLLFRLYGPKEGWIESGWQLPDVVRQ
ncbi:DUF1214 domain-containing protein [Pseudoruegeria sp. SHC-113]|uniref:DUF1214 domain-containing protein n=1 Tax=Pseudoruegeria sp. SHC-113 TaxID=2855439 RepID=UPI0021BA4D89|nr:DUF1214 domain-containing protein [Pseudoruegeria sp. SHC-113]MCT8161487.1 DUF1214 domain-containing protein [Pseudoruegeria sp. SHC-113]